MPMLWKDVLPEGQFLVSTKNGRVPRKYTKEFLRELANNNNTMLASGLKIPIPFDHVEQAEPLSEDAPTPSSYFNGGYCAAFTVTTGPDGKDKLRVLCDLPGSKDDPQTPYYKALNTNKEVSANIRNSFTDGLNRTWTNVFGHVALVNHAVVPGQNGFEIPGEIVNMSMEECNEPDQSAMVNSLKDLLKKAVKINLPASTTAETFLRDLYVAASQIESNLPDSGEVLEPVPIYMSTGDTMLTLQQAQTIVDSKAINPVTSKPYTLEDLGHKPAAPVNVNMSTEVATLKTQIADYETKLGKATSLLSAMSGMVKRLKETAIQDRVQALVNRGALTQQVYDATIKPQLSYNMSIDATTGDFAPHPLEPVLSILEATLPAQPQQSAQQQSVFNPFVNMSGGVVQPNPMMGNEMSAEDMEASIKELCGLVQM